MKCVGPTISEVEIKQFNEKYAFFPEIEEQSELFNIISNPVRLKIIHLLQETIEVCVCDLRDIMGISASAISQHLAKMKAYQLVKSRKDAQTVFYSLTEHPFLGFIPAIEKKVFTSKPMDEYIK